MLAWFVGVAIAQSIPNGDFENGTVNGWTVRIGPAGAVGPFVSEQEPVWVMEVDRGNGRAVVCSSAFVVTRDQIAAQMVNIDNRNATSDWWIEPVGGAASGLETESPDHAGQGWSDHALPVGVACGLEVVLCVEPERQEAIYYDDLVLGGAPCPEFVDVDDDGFCATGQDTDGDGECTGGDEIGGVSDCDDTSASTFPGAAEVCNGLDESCDGLVDETFDPDGDGWFCDDCDHVDPDVNPGGTEVCNTVDDDCDGQVDEGYDADLDGWSCDDCDDTVASTHPGAVEQCNGLDDDCNTLIDDDVQITIWWPDSDGDGYGDPDGVSIEGCAAAPGYVVDATDCDDGDNTVHPGADDPPLDGVDADCDGEDGVATGPSDTGGVTTPSDRGAPDVGTAAEAVGCGCAQGGSDSRWMVLVGLVAARAARRRGRPG